MKFGLLLVLASWSLNVQAFEVHLDSSGLQTVEIEATQLLIQKAIHLLPPLMKSRLNKKIKIEYKDLKELGRTYLSTIQLSNQLKAHIVAGADRSVPNTTTSSRHKTVYDLALGTLVHELSHQYDHFLVNETNPYRHECLSISSQQDLKPQHCTWFSFRRNISDSPQFLYSINWSQKEMKDRKILEEDDATARSPYAYEFKNSDEAFAVNMEFFLMDPEYKCRRPTGYEFLAKHFLYQPHKNHNCKKGQNVLTTINSSEIMGHVYEPLDASRVASVHYLLAGDGESMMSQWGHSMIRLVICAPHRKVLDHECLKDTVYHRVVSYRAGVTDLAISSMKGITGDYPSRLYVLPLLNVIHEYTQLELRELYSYPIQMSRPQINNIVQRVTEQNWTYRGKYFFSTNNCATETFNLFKNVVPENLKFSEQSINTPKGVRDALILSGLSQEIPDRLKSENGPYYWASKKNQFQRHVDQVSQASGITIQDVASFSKLQLNERQNIFNQVMKSGKYLSSMYVLVRQTYERLTMIRNAHIMNHEQKKSNSEITQLAKEMIRKDMHHGAEYFKGSYGIPSDREIEIVRALLEENHKNSKGKIDGMFKTYEKLTIEILGEDFLKDLNAQTEMMNEIKLRLISELKNKKEK